MNELQEQIKELEAEIEVMKSFDYDEIMQRAFDDVFGDLWLD